jgi:hypothetical protein
MSYWTPDEDDELEALFHQRELELRRWEETIQKDYEAWLDSFGPWWVKLDQEYQE